MVSFFLTVRRASDESYTDTLLFFLFFGLTDRISFCCQKHMEELKVELSVCVCLLPVSVVGSQLCVRAYRAQQSSSRLALTTDKLLLHRISY